MPFISGTDRFQIGLSETFSFESFIAEDNPVRVIDAFVDSLDLNTLGFKIYSGSNRGQKPYHTDMLLKIHIYCFFNGIQSSRKQERECSRNIELIWLTGNLKPDHSTLASFFKNNVAPCKKVFKEFNKLCHNFDLFSFEVEAIDGTKIKANCSKKNSFTISKLDSCLDNIDKKIEEYSSLLNNDSLDQEQINEFKKKLELVRKRKVDYTSIKQKLNDENISEYCSTDPDSKSMKNHQNIEPCYNLQSVVDGKNKLVASFDVTNQANDIGLLKPMVHKVINDFSIDNMFKQNPSHVMTALADTGYYKASDILDLNTDNIRTLVPKPNSSCSTGDYSFSKDNFKYVSSDDTYICPAGFKLHFSRFSTETRKGKKSKYKIYTCSQCTSCKFINKCTKSVNGRSIKRNINEKRLNELDAAYKSNSNAYKLRKALVEHPFGTIKRSLGFTHLFVRGIERASQWASFVLLAYNLKRVINILGTKRILEELSTV